MEHDFQCFSVGLSFTLFSVFSGLISVFVKDVRQIKNKQQTFFFYTVKTFESI